MTFRICSLASGSSGNAYYAESPDGSALLIDAGLSGKQLEANLRAAGGRPERVLGVLVTHDHHDHVMGAGVWHRKYRWPLFMTAGTWSGSERRLGRVERPRLFRPGSGLVLGGFRVECHATPHDGREPVCFVLERGGRRCGVLTDLGHAFEGLGGMLSTLDGVFLESNYNDRMLAANRMYPPSLKHRIRSRGGHLENRETGALLLAHAGERMRTVVLSHLSENNNRPEVALEDVGAVCGERLAAQGTVLRVAPRHHAGEWMVL